MPYKNTKRKSYNNYKKPKRQTGLVVLLICLSTLSLCFVAAIIGLETGFISFPPGSFPDFPLLQQYERPVNTTPSVSSDDGSGTESKPPAEPPKLTYDGAFNESTIAELEGLLAKNPWSIAVYYENISTGAKIEFNSKRKFPAGSVVKAPYCKWLLTTNPDLNETIIMQESSIADGGGKIKKEPIGTAFTVQQLIEYAIIDSDNTAYQMLTQRFGFDGYLSYVKDMGVGSSISKGNLFGSLSPAGTAILFKDIYNFSVADPEKSEILMTSMKNTAYMGTIAAALDAEVAHKYGWNGGNNGFHDAAIVYRDTPYVLTVFTNMNYEKSGVEDYIKSVIKCIDKLHSGN